MVFYFSEGGLPLISSRAVPLLLKVLQIHKGDMDITYTSLKALRFLTRVAACIFILSLHFNASI
jgi:hypothetical protein